MAEGRQLHDERLIEGLRSWVGCLLGETGPRLPPAPCLSAAAGAPNRPGALGHPPTQGAWGGASNLRQPVAVEVPLPRQSATASQSGGKLPNSVAVKSSSGLSTAQELCSPCISVVAGARLPGAPGDCTVHACWLSHCQL
jgi:hypothetical protein